MSLLLIFFTGCHVHGKCQDLRHVDVNLVVQQKISCRFLLNVMADKKTCFDLVLAWNFLMCSHMHQVMLKN